MWIFREFTTSSQFRTLRLSFLILTEQDHESGSTRPLWKLYTFNEEDILADPRLVVEHVLREQGLLTGSKYAVDQIMREFKPPRRPRPDTKSHLDFIYE